MILPGTEPARQVPMLPLGEFVNAAQQLGQINFPNKTRKKNTITIGYNKIEYKNELFLLGTFFYNLMFFTFF